MTDDEFDDLYIRKDEKKNQAAAEAEEVQRDAYIDRARKRAESTESEWNEKAYQSVPYSESKHPAVVANSIKTPETLEWGYSKPTRNDEAAAEAFAKVRKMLGMRPSE